MKTITIAAARPSDLPAVLALLERSGLPQEGLADHLATTLFARDRNAVVGSAALEVYGGAALLRSVAVDSTLRGQGSGSASRMPVWIWHASVASPPCIC